MPPQSPQVSASLPEGGATAFSPSGLKGSEFISIPWRVIFFFLETVSAALLAVKEGWVSPCVSNKRQTFV